MTYDKITGEQLEDKFFHAIECFDLKNDLLESTKEGHNKFVTEKEFRKMTPIFHDEVDMLTWFLKKDFKFKEYKYIIEKF